MATGTKTKKKKAKLARLGPRVRVRKIQRVLAEAPALVQDDLCVLDEAEVSVTPQGQFCAVGWLLHRGGMTPREIRELECSVGSTPEEFAVSGTRQPHLLPESRQLAKRATQILQDEYGLTLQQANRIMYENDEPGAEVGGEAAESFYRARDRDVARRDHVARAIPLLFG
jgi:hypothetical protein